MANRPPLSETQIAQVILAGFHRHYGLYRYNAQQAKTQFEAGHYQEIRKLSRMRIAFYDERVRETCTQLAGLDQA